ncbi:MAG: hypothetical protein D6715_04715 [Calditrichaeota bacterium]|nr:MAG: hypothetical protein D6715_04715 [Calditrichota bacterium]
MPTIVDIEFRRSRPERFIVHLDSGEVHVVSPETALKYGFALNRRFEESELYRILDEDEVRRAKDQALRYLENRPHSRHELMMKLRRKGYRQQAARQALAELEKVNLIDDRAYARLYIESELKRSPCSRTVLRHRLREKGIAPEVSEALLEEFFSALSEEELARQVAEKFLRTNRHLAPLKQKQRLIRLLQSRGFSWEVIETLLPRSPESPSP